MTDFFTIGETMLRLSPKDDTYLEGAHTLQMSFGGAESNVAANLAQLGISTGWYSRLPDNPLGRSCERFLRGYGVDVSSVDFISDARIGTFFVEQGAAPRGVQVVYDRANSAASQLQPDDLPQAHIRRSRWLHLSGITAALSDSCYATCHAAIQTAQAADIPVSFDVNYRRLLWSSKAAAQRLDPLCAAADTVFVALRDAVELFGAPNHPAEALHVLQQRWGGTLVTTHGAGGAYATDGTGLYHVPAFSVAVIHRIGAGDAFAAGYIYGRLTDETVEMSLRYGTGLAAFALVSPADIVGVRLPDLMGLLAGDTDTLKR